MSPKGKAAIFIAIALAWFGLAVVNLVNGQWLVAVVDVIAASVMIFFAHRSTHPRAASATVVRPLRAPRLPH